MKKKMKWALLSSSLLVVGVLGGSLLTNNESTVSAATDTATAKGGDHGHFDKWTENYNRHFTAKDLTTGKPIDISNTDEDAKTIFNNLRKEAEKYGFDDQMTLEECNDSARDYVKNYALSEDPTAVTQALAWNQDVYGFLGPKGYKLVSMSETSDGNYEMGFVPDDQYKLYSGKEALKTVAQNEKLAKDQKAVDANIKDFSKAMQVLFDIQDPNANNIADPNPETTPDQDTTSTPKTENVSDDNADPDDDDTDDEPADSKNDGDDSDATTDSDKDVSVPDDDSTSNSGDTNDSGSGSSDNYGDDNSDEPSDSDDQTSQQPENQQLPQTGNLAIGGLGAIVMAIGASLIVIPKLKKD